MCQFISSNCCTQTVKNLVRNSTPPENSFQDFYFIYRKSFFNYKMNKLWPLEAGICWHFNDEIPHKHINGPVITNLEY